MSNRFRLIVPALLPGVLLINTLALAAANDWPGHMGPRRDGKSSDTGLLRQWPADGPKLLWKNTALGAGWSSIAIADGHLYTTGIPGENQMLLCLDLDGKQKWKVAQGPRSTHNKYPAARSTPTLDAGKIYVTGAGGLVTCHNAADGKIVWSRDMNREMGGKVGGWQYAESVLILGNMECKTLGSFSVAGEGMSWAFPVVIGGRLYLRYDTNLYCYDVKGKWHP